MEKGSTWQVTIFFFLKVLLSIFEVKTMIEQIHFLKRAHFFVQAGQTGDRQMDGQTDSRTDRRADRQTDTFQCPAVSSCVCPTSRGLHPRLPTENVTHDKHGFLLHSPFVRRAKLFFGGGGGIIKTTKLTMINLYFQLVSQESAGFRTGKGPNMFA